MTETQLIHSTRLDRLEDLARELGVGRTTAHALLWSGTIPSVKIGRLRKVRRSDVDAFIEARLEKTSG
jgi:excisionase family DNA binding protein